MKALFIRLGCGILIAGTAVLTQAPSAMAQDKQPTKAQLTAAKKHYGEGDKKFKAGDFAGAEADFKAADDIKPAPQTERYIGMCEDALGHYQVAVDWYDKFLSHVPDKLSAQGDEIRKREADIKALPGKVHIDSNPPGASINIDDKPSPTPTPADVDLPPGTHVIKLTASGRLPAQKSVDVAFASKQTVSADLDALPPSGIAAVPTPAPAQPAATGPTPTPPPPEPRSKVPAFVTGGLAIVAAGVGTVFGVITLNDKSDYDKHPTTSTADNGDTHALITDMSFGVALTFGVTSAVLFLTSDEPPPASASARRPQTVEAKMMADAKRNRVTVTPAPIVSGSSGGAGVLVRF